MKEPIVHIVGARPNFVKAAPVVRALHERGAEQRVVHTGQHYDEAMSDVFFRELHLPEPDENLGVGSGSHARQTAALLTALEECFLATRPSFVVVYGDVNSTLAATLVASKLQLRVAHVEAGLRSFDATMPEEVNRRVTDALADLLFVTSPEAVGYLGNEGIDLSRVHFVGNPMIDTLLGALDRLDPAPFRAEHGLDGAYGVATFHRPVNVDEPAVAKRIVEALREVTQHVPVLLPLHPRGRAVLESVGLLDVDGLRVLEPMGYVQFLSAVRGASFVVTDSGGIQEETTMLRVPCLTLRPNTERPITITHGTNRLVTVDDMPDVVDDVLAGRVSFPEEQPPLWDGKAGPRVAAVLARSV